MEGSHYNPHLHHHHHHQLTWQPQSQPQPQPWLNGNVDSSFLPSSASDRYPQWSFQETKDFLVIRDDLDQAFMEMKRNKPLWVVISSKMREKGYNRNAEQCKCKWKNLVTRYKGCETSESEEMRQQFPFFNDMQAIFGARNQRMLGAEEEGRAGSSSRKKPTMAALFLEGENEEEEDDSEEEERGRMKKKKKVKRGGSGGSGEVRSLLEDFMKQQLELEAKWREAFEARESERKAKEMEWRETMEALENERIVMDQRWREKEEQRRAREEARAEKRDALIAALLNELRKRNENVYSLSSHLAIDSQLLEHLQAETLLYGFDHSHQSS